MKNYEQSMKVFFRFVVSSVILVILVGCSTTNLTTSPEPVPSQLVTEVDGNLERPPTFVALPSATLSPSTTPNQTQTTIAQDIASMQSAEQTLVAQYPHVCETLYGPREFSPNRLWLVELCYSENDQDLILTLSNKDTQDLWKLAYQDYMPAADFVADGGIGVVYWSNDEKYAYFRSYLAVSGGDCFVSGNFDEWGLGLFRLDLQTGETATILPVKDNFGWYGFSFSLTGRRLVYGAYARDFKVLDIKTGQLTDVVPVSDFNEGGGLIWSLSGSELIYSTVSKNEISEPIAYSLRLVDAQSGSERILLESPENCFVARTWTKDNVITIEVYDENYDRTLLEYDLSSNKIVSEATATSFP